jgi:hypothetical protein
MGKFTGYTILLQIRNVAAGVMDIPLFEVSAENSAMRLLLRTARQREAC